MNATIILLANGFFLSFILLVLLIIFSIKTNSRSSKKRKKVSQDLKKIKDQINGE